MPTLILTLVLLITFTSFISASPLLENMSSNDSQRRLGYVISNVNFSNIIMHVKNLVSFGNLYTGYPGSSLASNYIFHYLKEVLCLKTWLQNYSALVPYDYNSTLMLLSPMRRAFRVYAFAPNIIETCKGKVRGELVYLHKGELDELESVSVKDKIVLLDVDSGFNWLTLVSLGARAVIFIEKPHVPIKEYTSKTIDIPLRFPRAFIRMRDARELMKILDKGSVVAELDLNMKWIKTNLTNIIALIPGSRREGRVETVIVATHYDAHSTIPGLILSTRNVINTAVLLEFTRLVKMSKPLRSILIVFFSGSALSMAGVREFAKELSQGRIKISSIRWWWLRRTLALAFDLYPSSSPLIVLSQGNFYGKFEIVHKAMNSLLKYITNIGEYNNLSKVYVIHGRKYCVDLLPLYYKVKHMAEIFNQIGIPSVTFYAPNDYEYSLNSTFSESDFQLLRPQLEFSYFLTYSLINDSSLLIEEVFMQETSHWGLYKVKGRVIYPIDMNLKREEVREQYLTVVYVKSPYHDFITSTDNEGCFEVYGLGHNAYLRSNSWWIIIPIPYEISAFLIDRESGKIICASKSQNINTRRWYEETLNLTLFRCGSIALHGVLIDTNTFHGIFISERDISIIESISLREISTWNFYLSHSIIFGQIVILIVPSNISLNLIITNRKTREPIVLLKNLTLSEGEYVNLYPWEVISRMLEFIKSMLAPLAEDPTMKHSLTFVNECYRKAFEDYRECIQSLPKANYLRAYALMYRSLYSTRRAYCALRGAYGCITIMNLFLLCILAPFTLIVGELLFTSRGLKRALYLTFVLIGVGIVLLIMHPGFRIHSNLLIFLSGTISLLTSLLTLAFLFSENYHILKELRELILGKHFMKISYIGYSLAAISMSIRSMRKRATRTVLTLLTVMCLVISTTFLSSWRYNDVVVMRAIKGVKMHRVEVLVREFPIDLTGTESEQFPIPMNLVRYLRGYFGNCFKVYPRARLAGPTIIVCKRTGRSMRVHGSVIGLEANDPVLGPLIKGLWREQEAPRVAVITSDLKELLGVSVGDKITIGNCELIVIKVLPREVIDTFVEIDGYLITPIFLTKTGIVQESSYLVLLPFKTLIEIGGVVTSVSIYPASIANNSLLIKAKEISQQLSKTYNIYYSDGDTNYLLSCISSYELSRPESFLIPFAFLCLTLSSTILGSVYERRREMNILASLGMSPAHVTLTALTEGLVYSIIGVITGYIIVMLIGWVMHYLGYTIPLDVSAPHLPLALMLSIIAVLVSSVYPSLKVSRTITPSLRRKWRALTRPIDNEWYIPLPFRVRDSREALGLMRYLSEYFENIPSRDLILVEPPTLKIEESGSIMLSLAVIPPPQDAGVLTRVKVVARPSREEITLGIHFQLKSGKRYIWVSSCKKLADYIRKQILLWRSLKPEEREAYFNSH